MQFAKGKTRATAIAFILMFSMAVSMMLVPASNAFDPDSEIPTFASILAVPDPVGVTQYTYIYMWIDKVFDSAAYVNDYRFHNFKLTITDPDGETEVHEWETVWDTTSSQGFSYSPSKVGTYTLKFEFPGQDINEYSHNPDSAYVDYTYPPASAETTLTVLDEPIPEYPGSYPLPEEYWTRPIYGENPGWYSISSDWLGTSSPQYSTYNRYIADGVGPTTSHIMWTKPLQTGGVVGGDNLEIQGDTYFEGSAYISRYTNPIIVAGRLYYKKPFHFSSGSGGPTVCVDLRTGEEIWSRTDLVSLSFALIYATHQPNQHGVMQPLLIAGGGWRSPVPSGQWWAYDAETGDLVFNMTDVPSGTTILGPQGEHLIYTMTNYGTSEDPDWYMAQWNSSRPYYRSGGLTPSVSGEINASDSSFYDWNVSISWRNTMSSLSVVKAIYNDIMLCYEGSLPGFGRMGRGPYVGDPYTYVGVNLNPDEGEIGRKLWDKTLNAPESGVTVVSGVVDPWSRVFTESHKETMQWTGYDLDSGDKLWGPTESQAALDYYGFFFPGLSEGQSQAPGRLFSAGMAGIVYCYNITTGDVMWTYGNGGEGNSTDSGFQVPGPYPTFIWAVANDVVYTMTTEHTVQTPIYKDARVRAINATDGTEIWTLSNYNGGGADSNALADGFATFFNGYDDQVYVVGRGPSATTVSIQNDIITHGESVVVKGTVTDISAGTKLNEQAARFPNGVPVISDANMTDWMGYIYQQKPLPTDATGVEVIVSVLDPNNNCYEVARTTSDTSGYFGCTFEPEVPGFYKVIATFGGSEGYWGSSAETFLNVKDTPQPTPVPTPEPKEPVGTYFAISTIVMVVAIAIVAFLILRRR
jgi:hypothetical protein